MIKQISPGFMYERDSDEKIQVTLTESFWDASSASGSKSLNKKSNVSVCCYNVYIIYGDIIFEQAQ